MSIGGPDEQDTCQDFVLPAIRAAGWDESQVHEQVPVQAELRGPLLPIVKNGKRRADYVLELDPGVPLVVIEAKRLWAEPGDGIQQAQQYASKLDAPFSMSTNGTGWVLYNSFTGHQEACPAPPTPVEAWALYVEQHNLNQEAQALIRSGFNRQLLNADQSVRELRYYQRRAIHEILAAIAQGHSRILIVMATGSGKTFTALQLVWKLWNYRRTRQIETDEQNYRVLYLADRDVLVSDPWRKTFRPVFGDATTRVRSKSLSHSPDIYFSTYQVLDVKEMLQDDDGLPTESAEPRVLLEQFPSDFFDLVIVDECHRGSAREDSEWRAILDHFVGATQLGLTATPVDHAGADTYAYFGNPVFTYSLAEGIADGFLAPYTIRRVVFNVDADGLEVVDGLVDMSGRPIPAGVYGTRDYERTLRLPDRTKAMARKILDVVGGRNDRVIVFCVDAEHARLMTQYLRNAAPARTASDPEWAVRIMSVEREKNRLLEQFTDPERDTPQIAVTSSLLSTGVDIEDLKYVVLARWVGNIAEFKQIIGRGTRLYPEKDKFEFEIIDFVGATGHFRDDKFDGPPLKPPTTDALSPTGEENGRDGADHGDGDPGDAENCDFAEPSEAAEGSSPGEDASEDDPAPNAKPEKFVLYGVSIEVSNEGFWIHDTATGRPRLVKYLDWASERVLNQFDGPGALLRAWADARSRADVISMLRQSRIDPDLLSAQLPSEEPVDLVDHLLHLAWGTPKMTRAERARRAKTNHTNDLQHFSNEAQRVLELILDRYADAGIEEISAPTVVEVPPLSSVGSPREIASFFGGPGDWHAAHRKIQTWLFPA